MQEQGRGMRPCAYISFKLSPTQQRWPAYERELFAMVKCLEIWKYYLHGRKVKVETDHAPLKYFQTQQKVTYKVVRWLDFL